MTTSLNRMTRRPLRFMWIGAISVLVPVLLVYVRFAVLKNIQVQYETVLDNDGAIVLTLRKL